MEEIFIQTEEQRAILESVRRFVEEEVTPRAAMLDSNPDPEDGFSWEIVEAADAFGLRTMALGLIKYRRSTPHQWPVPQPCITVSMTRLDG